MYTYAVSSLDDGGGEEKKRKEGEKKKKCIYKYRKKHGNAPCHHRCSAQISFAPRSRQLDCYNSEIKIARWSLDRERSGLKATWYPLSLSLSHDFRQKRRAKSRSESSFSRSRSRRPWYVARFDESPHRSRWNLRIYRVRALPSSSRDNPSGGEILAVSTRGDGYRRECWWRFGARLLEARKLGASEIFS